MPEVEEFAPRALDQLAHSQPTIEYNFGTAKTTLIRKTLGESL